MALHVIPFALVLPAANGLLAGLAEQLRLRGSILLVSTGEAVFQVTTMQEQASPVSLTVFVAISLYLFGITELTLYRRFDYATMFAFRMIYYAYWHLAWGSLRPHWLF
jgi:hypothetical protein